MRKFGLSVGILTLMFLTTLRVSAMTYTVSSNPENWTQLGGPPTSGDTVNVPAGFRLTIDVGNAQCGTLVIGNTGTGPASVSFVSGSKLTVTSGLTIGSTNAPGSIDMSLGGTLTVNSVTEGNVGSFVPGSGTVVFNNGSTITLPANPAFATYNTLTIAASTAKLAGATTISTLNLGDPSGSSGTVDLNAQSLTATSIGILGGNANTVRSMNGPATFTVNIPTGSLSYGGMLLDNNLTLNKDGPGTLILTGNSNSFGATQVSSGTLQLGAPNCLSTGPLVLGSAANSSGMLDLHGFNQTVFNIQTSGSGTGNMLQNSTGQSILTFTDASTGGGTYGGGISGSGLTLNINSSGTFTLSGGAKNNFAGNINLLSGTLRIGVNNSLSQSTILTLGSGSNNTTFDMNGLSQTLAGLGTSGTGTATINGSGSQTLTVGSTLSPNPNSTFIGQLNGNFNLAIDAGTTLTLGGTAAFAGTTQVLNGTLKFAQAYANFPAVTLGNNATAGTLDLNGNDIGIFSLASSGTSIGNTIRDSSALQPQMSHTLTLNQGLPTTYAGTCTAYLVMNGSSTLTLGQSNAIANLTVANGTVKSSVNNIFMSGAALVMGGTSSAGTFDLNGKDQQVGTIATTGGLATSNIITSTSGTPTLAIMNTTPGPVTFNGAINGSVTLTINDNTSSTFFFAGGGYMGNTTISGGPVVMTGSTGSSFTVNGNTGGPLSGTGQVGSLTVNNNAIVSPGTGTVGTLSAASANFSAGGILKIRIPSNTSADQLNVFSGLTLGGTSQLALDLTGYDPTFPKNNFTVAHSTGLTGQFNTVSINGNSSGYAVNVSYTPTGDVVVTVGAVPVISNTPFPGATAGSNFTYTISATNNPMSYGTSALPAGLSLIGNQITGVPTTAGNYSIDLTATNKGGTSSIVTLPLTVSPGPFAKLQVLLPNETAAPGTPTGKTGTLMAQNAGSTFTVTVNAVDNQWNKITSINNTVHFTSNDATATLPADAALSSGTQTFSVTLTAASPPAVGQPTALTVSDTADNTKNGPSANITVNRGMFSKLQILLPGEAAQPGSLTGKTGAPPQQQQATMAFNVQVNAVDDFWNVVSSNDSVALTSSDPLAGLRPAVALNNGSRTINVTLNLGPSQTFIATDTSDNTKAADTSSSVGVRPGPYVKLLVLAPNETNLPGSPNGKTGTLQLQQGGTAFPVTVYAVDAFWTPVLTINDVVSLTSSDPGAILPLSASLVGGMQTFNVTLTTGPAQTVSASDVTDGSKLSNTSSSIAVATITSTLTSISPTAGVKNGAAFTLTVTGTQFLSNSVVQWNGAARPTTFVSDTQLTAAIPASDLANAGLVDVTVFSPPPGTGATAAGTFYVYSGTTVGTWIVRNTNDSGQDSLRLALASCRNGDLITFDSTVFDLTNSNAATFINVLSALPMLDKGNVTIDASYERVTINGSGAGSSSGLDITSSNNKVLGLSIIGFSRSGISLEGGAQNNTIGGSRTIGNTASGTPPGPNGAGLRISGNGTFGVQISDPTTSGNVVKGCWIGLDISGTEANPNLAGILLQNGAHDNTIGGTGDGEQNVISGNAAEGITVSGTGSDNNTVIANVIGVAAAASTGTVTSRDAGDDIFSRSAVANGSSGIFLSRGTQNTSVGLSSTDDESMTAKTNIVGYNGGSGIEVRASTSKQNSSRGNRISHNGKSGIALFDGSNGGITAPSFTSVSIIGGRSTGADTRSTATVRVVGSATNSDGSAGSGTIEVFSDSSDEGASILGRSSVIAGVFDMQVSVSDLSLNLTATYTDANGNTSPYSVYGALNSGSGGASDPTTTALDTLLGIDPTNLSDAPTGMGTVSVGKFLAGLNFAKTGHDSIQAAFAVQLPTGFTAAGATVGAVFDANSAKVTLDSKGKAPAGNTAVKITQSKASSLAVVTFTIRNGDLLSGFATSGLTNKTTAKTGEQDTVPVGLALMTSAGAKYIYTGTVTVTYKATQGKSGKAMKK